MSLSIVKTILGSISYKLYKTIIIIIIIVRRPIIIGLSNCPAISPQRRTLHTRANEDKGQSILRPSAHHPYYIIFVIKRARGQSRTPSECRQFFETAQVKLEVLCMCRGRPSALFRGWVYFECCVDAAVRETERNGTRKVKKPLCFSSSLEIF